MDKADALNQLDAACKRAREQLEGDERPLGTSSEKLAEAITMCASTIDRLTASGSVYGRQMKRVLDRQGASLSFYVSQLLGILEGLRYDIEAGYLQTFEEELHADVFADFLEMADHLVGEARLAPGAVVAGSALEAHLRALAEKVGVSTEFRGRPKRAGRLNDDLAKQGAYRKAEHKQVLAWQDLRNTAAHGDEDFSAEEVRLMVQGVRDFIVRHPA